VRYEMMFPDEVRQAIDQNWPVVLPLGVLEYHGEHMVTGVDALVVLRALQLVEDEFPLVILPPFYYGASSYVVEPPDRNGTVHVDSEALVPFGYHLFLSLLRIGFRNVHAIIHHQTENFAAGMPTDLSFKLAGRRATFDYLGTQRGEGWWGDNTMSEYYEQHEAGDNPFNWVQIHPLMDEAILERYEFDHAGVGETSLLMALDANGVDLNRLNTEKWYLESAARATVEHGHEAVEMIVQRLTKLLRA